MSERLRYLLARMVRTTWWRCALVSVFALVAVLISALAGPYIPESLASDLGADAVGSILTILASSMLTVAIFSANGMVTALGAVSSSATPRASQLVVQDSTAQNTLAVFIGTFVYSLIGLVGMSAHIYDHGGRLVLFGFTLVLLVFVIVVLLRWLDYLSTLGRLGATLARVERATRAAMEQRLKLPHLGGQPQAPGQRGAHAVPADRVGFVEHVSMDLLDALAGEHGTMFHVHALPGRFVDPSVALASADAPLDADARARVLEAFSIGSGRTFDHDPRFGLVVLGEVGARAMSASVNDPGTALEVIASGMRLLVHWAQASRAESEPPKFARVSAPPLRAAGMVEDIFAPLARYAAAAPEVGLALQRGLRSLDALGHAPFAEAARAQSAYALERARRADLPPGDLAQLEAAAPPAPQDRPGPSARAADPGDDGRPAPLRPGG